MTRVKHILMMIYGAILYLFCVKIEQFIFFKALPYIGYYVHHPKSFKWHEPYDLNKCQCADENGNPLNKCDECPR
jgi:hypothetical protein